MRSIRGATTVANNEKEEILSSTKELLTEMLKANEIEIEDIISIFFTATKDLTKVYPAVVAREMGIVDAGLMCMTELYVEESLTKCIRVMIHAQINKSQKEINHIYLKDAKGLRPDLTKE